MRNQSYSAILARTLVDTDRRLVPDAPPFDEQTPIDELAMAASMGDAQALGHLYDELVGPIYRYVLVRLRRREDAEDVTQVVFGRIVSGLPGYKHNGRPFAAWAFRIARNAVIDHVRRARPVEPLDARSHHSDGDGLETLTLRGEEVRELRRAIRELTPDQQEALALRFVAGLTADEAAAVMGRRAGTIRGLTFRAIASLRRRLLADPLDTPERSGPSVARPRV